MTITTVLAACDALSHAAERAKEARARAQRAYDRRSPRSTLDALDKDVARADAAYAAADAAYDAAVAHAC